MTMLAHNVFFALRDNAQEAKDKLIEACNKYLSTHPGIVLFACGVLADELRRDVNDRDFDVALHILFENQMAHDGYQAAPLHERFINENKANWKKVRVFDSLVDTISATASELGEA